MASAGRRPRLTILSTNQRLAFQTPVKKINDGNDVQFWLQSKAYSEVMTFLLQLNIAMFPVEGPPSSTTSPIFSETITKLQNLISKLSDYIDEAPPDPGPRRFGNISFRRWYEIVELRINNLLLESLPKTVVSSHSAADAHSSALNELEMYLMGSFGSPQRLDYGTGHELSFLAFLAGIWKLEGFAFAEESHTEGDIERQIVVGLIIPYLSLVRRLIGIYNLEPAGSHGVWGLDDHAFLPYIFGSAQLSPSIPINAVAVPQEGSAPGAPNPAEVAKKKSVDGWRGRNMYFDAIGFIYDVKTGPFWEHSPMLYDISGVPAGWAKINKGMLKMYHAEVLSKFPVVQHFPFGALFPWEQDTNAATQAKSIHADSQPQSKPSTPSTGPSMVSGPQAGMQAPWATSRTGNSSLSSSGISTPTATARMAPPQTGAPWTRQAQAVPVTSTRMPSRMSPATGAPWATGSQARVDGQAQSVVDTGQSLESVLPKSAYGKPDKN
ncbi:Phosphotyrosyl phosphatase activator [Microthyrium microscopicum]|uniref:Serine/threonine-protein phosphatase 2A activator n=1 Tax=Microthyrium microscopicum TaxID=703497 RepID=A0A6A6UEI9_9PEZI|nr:Phosphotyrosyl phosphatase activator [Microthyrium microscopicum]